MFAAIIFYAFAALLILTSLSVVLVKNPVHAILSLILAFFTAAGLFVLLGAEFIAMILIIVYVGAVMVLFLFVVMMLDINFVKLKEGFIRYVPLALLVAAIMLTELYLILGVSIEQKTFLATPQATTAGISNTHAIGAVLYTDYIFPFQLAGGVLLVAMIGAIVLTLRHRDGVKRQKISRQVHRTVKESLDVVRVESGKGVNTP